jgi:hypothetical protein
MSRSFPCFLYGSFILERYQRETDTAAQINMFCWDVVDSQSFPLVVPENTQFTHPQDIAHTVSDAGKVHPHCFRHPEAKLTLPQQGIDVLVICEERK